MKAKSKLLTGEAATKIYDRWSGYAVEDCLCKYCLYYIRRRKDGEIICWREPCICMKEVNEAIIAGRIKAAKIGKGGLT